MSIHADPAFVAAEIAYRTGQDTASPWQSQHPEQTHRGPGARHAWLGRALRARLRGRRARGRHQRLATLR